MGYSLSWLAVRGKSPQAIRDELGLRLTGKREAIPEADLSSVEMPNGWYVLVSNRSEQVAPDAALLRLSASGGEIITCFVEEHVMCSSATHWKDGQRIWSVIHNSEDRRGHLKAEGDLPPALDGIVTELQARQHESDKNQQRVDFIFEVPVKLAQSVVGFRHDQDIPGLSGAVFDVLVAEGDGGGWLRKQPSIWKRFFGM